MDYKQLLDVRNPMGSLHGDSRFKKEGHGRSIVDTPGGLLNTKTGAKLGHLFDR